MKKALDFVINSVAMFVSYIFMMLVLFVIFQTVLRTFIPADTVFEYLWKTILCYALMIVVCVGHFLLRNASQKPKYFAYIENRDWNIKDTAAYVIKNPDFWLNCVAFSIWPIVLPQLFAVISMLYVGNEFWAVCPKSLINIPTVIIPFVIFSFISWIAVLYNWDKNRLHK